MIIIGGQAVTHRIGGLEINSIFKNFLKLVTHRIGGLEKLAQQKHDCFLCYTPHRWLRNLMVRNVIII